MSENEDPLVVLTRFYNPSTAHIARGYLETNDIPCFIFDEHMNSIAWHLQIGVGGIRLMIPASYHAQASTMLLEQDLVKARDIQPLLPKTSGGKMQAVFFTILFFITGLFPWKRTSKQ